MGRRGRGFVSNRRHALGPGPAASRRTAPRPGGPPGSVDDAEAAFEGLQSGFQVLNGLIDDLYCDGVVLVPGSQFWLQSEE